MIKMSFTDGTWCQVEAARVYIPGFEAFELYATPWYENDTHRLNDNCWGIIERQTGMRLTDWPSSRIEDAVTAAIINLTQRGITADKLQMIIQNLLNKKL